MSKSAVFLSLTIAAISVLVGAAALYHANQLRHASHVRSVAVMLEPVEALLSENRAIIHELHMPSFTESNAAISESYLIKFRRDGAPTHAGTKQRLD